MSSSNPSWILPHTNHCVHKLIKYLIIGLMKTSILMPSNILFTLNWTIKNDIAIARRRIWHQCIIKMFHNKLHKGFFYLFSNSFQPKVGHHFLFCTNYKPQHISPILSTTWFVSVTLSHFFKCKCQVVAL